ncbi:chemokine (C-C motif) ligand 34b, duplicate 4 [Chelmon rostratus]|uniref:chemokine (C-C motif) ligand 34b, duplicate 4 n=1 Tax=Chelmon rostratus TaxID=109905 RepID=UPI001BE9EC0D|nr:chemokine (C-C motif) ligand 34b, duplicate 4 [Chelmon rostratus]
MSTRILSITLLLCVCLCFQSCAGNLRHAYRRFPPPCCVNVSTANISHFVTGHTYREQSAQPPCVKAILFNTKQGQVCADPKVEWVQKLAANMTKL